MIDAALTLSLSHTVFSFCLQLGSADIAPGTKIILRDVNLKDGVLLLEPRNIVDVIGEVDYLREAWAVKQVRPFASFLFFIFFS